MTGTVSNSTLQVDKYLTKDLADFRRCDEITLRSKYISLHVIPLEEGGQQLELMEALANVTTKELAPITVESL
jgi:hypothetical protein